MGPRADAVVAVGALYPDHIGTEVAKEFGHPRHCNTARGAGPTFPRTYRRQLKYTDPGETHSRNAHPGRPSRHAS